MPLTKLFKRRNSSQKDEKKSATSSKGPAPDCNSEGAVADNQDQTKTSKSSEISYLEDKSNTVLKENCEIQNSDIQPDSHDLNDETCDNFVQSETNRRFSTPETSDFHEQDQKKSRSLSLKESGTNLLVQRTRRKKYASESATFSSTDDEGFEDKVIQLRERDLEKVIGQCVDRIIRDSILTAVKSVKVDNLYEDVIKSLSRSGSESSETSGVLETVQQKLHTESVTEYADLQTLHTFEEEEIEEDKSDETQASKQKRDCETSHEVSNQFQPNIQYKNDEIDSAGTGEAIKYQEPEKCTEADLTFVDKMEYPKTTLEISEPDNCLHPSIPTDADIKNSNKSAAHHESSTCLDQNDKFPTDTQTSESNHSESFIELDETSIKYKEFHETVESEKARDMKDYQENSVPSKRLEESNQNESGEDTVDCSRLKKDHTPRNESIEEVKEREDEQVDVTDNCRIEVEGVKDISMDGYHADIEESMSINSMVSESSFENISKVFSRTISDDTVASVDEGSLGGQLDATVNKDTGESTKPQCRVEKVSNNLTVEDDLMAMSGEDFSYLLTTSESTVEEPDTPGADLGESLPEQKPVEEEKKVNWKVGYLHVKLPHKSRHKGLKVWKKRCVAIQPDEFASDDSEPCLVLSVYSGDSSAAKKHSASFWKSISCQKAVIYRSSSRTHQYSFTISDDKKAVIHLSADSEAISQEWMAAIRAILWPPSPVVQLEKMLNGREFEISIIDNEFSYHAGLLGTYGYLTITPKKLILVHPQQGYVIQEWYLNTIDKFQLIPQTRIEDVNKILSMTTCSDSSTGKGDIMIFCKEAVSLLQTIASTIHQILTYHSKQEGGTYQKELEEIGAWLLIDSSTSEDYYKVPPRQVKSLLDIPNFIFDKPISPVATVAGTPGVAMDSQKPTLDVPKANPTRASQDSGISSETVSDDFLNCSTTSFVLGGGNFPGKSSDSELSDTYTPPRSPEVKARREAEAPETITKA